MAAAGGKYEVEEQKAVMLEEGALAAALGCFEDGRLRFGISLRLQPAAGVASSSSMTTSSSSELKVQSDASKLLPPSLSLLLTRGLLGCTAFSLTRCAPVPDFFFGIALLLMLLPCYGRQREALLVSSVSDLQTTGKGWDRVNSKAPVTHEWMGTVRTQTFGQERLKKCARISR